VSQTQPLNRNQNVFSKRRLAYTLAAGAASVGISKSDATAAISYSGIQDLAINQGSSQDLNLDGDANTDIRLKNYAYTNGINYQGATVSFFPGQIVGFQTNNLYYVKALHAGDTIDATTVGPTFYGSMALGNPSINENPNAQFTNVDNAYIGLDFRIKNGSDLFYGWVRVSVNNAAGTFVIHDWAYQTVGGVGILAGDVGTVGVAGDYNGNGVVDMADYVLWRNGGPLQNEVNSIGTVDASDYTAWRANFGETSSGSGAAVSANSVPEPLTLGLFAAGSVGLGLLRRVRRGKS